MWTTVEPGTLARATIQALVDICKVAGHVPLRIKLPAGSDLTWATDLNLRGAFLCWLDGVGRETDGGAFTKIGCTSALNGADQTAHNDLFNACNDPLATTVYYRSLWFSNMTLDCTNQNAGGGGGFGINLCAIEAQNVHDLRCWNLEVIKAYGSGIVFGSLDPGFGARVINALIENVLFTQNCRAVLPGYGITGSVIQAGAATGVRIRRNRIISPGGPACDAFNAHSEGIYEENYHEGVTVVSSFTASQAGHINSFHSDFGLDGWIIRNNTWQDAGGLFLSGNMVPTFFNDYVATPGPNNCQVYDNLVSGTGLAGATAFGALAADTVYGNVTGYPFLIRWSGSNTAIPQISPTGAGVWTTVTKTGHAGVGGGEEHQFLVPTGYDYRFHVTGPAFTRYDAPNANTAHFIHLGGNSAITGTVAAGSDATHINLSGNASILSGDASYNEVYFGFVVTITGGTGVGQSRTIDQYVGTTGIAEVSVAWTTPTDGTSTFALAKLGLTADNVFRNNTSEYAPAGAFVGYDGRANLYEENKVYDCGDCVVAVAFDFYDTAVVQGTGFRDNTMRRNHIEDRRAVKKLVANYRDSSANCVDNVWDGNRVETGSSATYLPTTAARFFRARSTGPAAGASDSQDWLPGEKAGALTAGGQHPRSGSLGRARLPL